VPKSIAAIAIVAIFYVILVIEKIPNLGNLNEYDILGSYVDHILIVKIMTIHISYYHGVIIMKTLLKQNFRNPFL